MILQEKVAVIVAMETGGSHVGSIVHPENTVVFVLAVSYLCCSSFSPCSSHHSDILRSLVETLLNNSFLARLLSIALVVSSYDVPYDTNFVYLREVQFPA